MMFGKIFFIVLLISSGVAGYIWFEKGSALSFHEKTLYLEAPRMLPNVSLTTSDNQPTDWARLSKTDWQIFSYGYTYCPDICPMTLAGLTEVYRLVEKAGKNIAISYLSVDPKRDTPERLKTYLAYFRAPITGLIGSDKDTLALSKGLGMVYSVPEEAKEADKMDYLVDHGAAIYLIRPDGKLQAIFRPVTEAPFVGYDAEVIAEDILKIL